MKKMTAEELRRVALLTREWSAQGGMIPSQQLILDLQQHIAALETEVTQARERALEEAAECAVRPGWKTRECDDVANDIRALKSRPALEPDPGVADYCPEAGPARLDGEWKELASEENGLLPMSKRRCPATKHGKHVVARELGHEDCIHCGVTLSAPSGKVSP